MLFNLGLKVINSSNPLEYQTKVVNFLDLAASEDVKVFAMLGEFEETDSLISDGRPRALRKMRDISYYQKNVRNTPNHSSYYNKKAHFHGVVTNLEPWILGGWNNKYTISGQDTILVPADTGCMCYANSRKSNDTILGHYLELIAEMYDSLDSKGFFNPSVHPNADTSLQDLDELYMGTVHWKWHYFSQAKSYFPNGDFSLYVGERGGKHYFDILLPETYCSYKGINCMALACTDEEITKLCYNDIDPHMPTGKVQANAVHGLESIILKESLNITKIMQPRPYQLTLPLC